MGDKIVDHSYVVGAPPVALCSNYIFILDLIPGFKGLGKGNCKRRREVLGLDASYIRDFTVCDHSNIVTNVYQFFCETWYGDAFWLTVVKSALVLKFVASYWM